MNETLTCVTCGQPLDPDEIVCKFCDDSAYPPQNPGIPNEVTVRTLTRRAWGIMFVGLIILQPILLPANVYLALSTLSKAKALPTRIQSLETQLKVIAFCSLVLSVVCWGLIFHIFG